MPRVFSARPLQAREMELISPICLPARAAGELLWHLQPPDFGARELEREREKLQRAPTALGRD